jgi:hypothetical protein
MMKPTIKPRVTLAALELRCVTGAEIMSDIMDAAPHCALEHSLQPDEMSDITVYVGAARG